MRSKISIFNTVLACLFLVRAGFDVIHGRNGNHDLVMGNMCLIIAVLWDLKNERK